MATFCTPCDDEKANFVRLYLLIIGEGTKALRNAFSRKQSSETLKDELKLAKPELRKRKKKILSDNQWELLFPAAGDPSYENFDIALLFVLLKNGIGNLSIFTPPPGGWDKLPNESDESDEANFVRIKCYRNEICHFPLTEIEGSEYESWWKKVSEAIVALGADKKDIDSLKNKPMDSSFVQLILEAVKTLKNELTEELQMEITKVTERVDDLETNLNDLKNKPDTQTKQNLNTELPGHVPNFVGRAEEIKKIVDYLSASKTNAVLVTGGPGYGKTSVAIEAAHEVAEKTTVIFCFLGEYANTFTDLLRHISFVCTREVGKPIEDDHKNKITKYKLLNWCKDLDKNLVFFLDGVEEALEGDHKKDFIKLLTEMSTCSNCRIQFLITSRKEFASTASFSIVKVPIQRLSTQDSAELIKQSFEDSRVDAEIESLNDEQLKSLAEVADLCDCVPLGLCIAGALLTDYNIQDLIIKLKNNPAKALEDNVSGNSIKKAFATSFDSLDDKVKLSLISLSVFRGAFDKAAARSLPFLADDCEETLRLLKAKSLLQKERDEKYSMHSLIQSCARNIGEEEYADQYRKAEQKYIDYSVSLLRDHSKLFWSLDGCKESIEQFNNDRIHIEYAMKNFSILSQSSQSVDEISAEEFGNISQYAKMCVPPNLYELFLKSFFELTEKSSDALLRVQVLCQIGKEKRKQSLDEEYEKIMERAYEIRLRNITQFESRRDKQTELYFWNSYIRYLSEMKQAGSDIYTAKLKEAQASLEATHLAHCENFGDEALSSTHTLDELGIRTRRFDQNYNKARKIFSKSLTIKKRYLGVHILTFYSIKDLADLELKIKNFKEALQRYQNSMETLEKLDMSEGKEAILCLKNKARCLMYLEKYGEAEETLQKAISIADENYEGDHSVKLALKYVEAILHMHRERNEEGKKTAQEAIKMSKRLKRCRWDAGGEVHAIFMGTWTKNFKPQNSVDC